MVLLSARLRRRFTHSSLPGVRRTSVALATIALPALLAVPGARAQQVNPFGLTNAGSSLRPALGDLDGDGDQDVLACSSTGLFRFQRNTGSASSPTFAAATESPFGLPPCERAAIALADIDADGDLDLFSGASGNAGFYYYENTGTATSPAFAAAQQNPFGLTAAPPTPPNAVSGDTAPAFADFDGDGDLDLLSGEKSGSFYYYENQDAQNGASGPSFLAPVLNPFGLTDPDPVTGDTRSAPAVGDYSGDGLLDVLAGASDGNFYFYRNTGTATVPVFAPVVVNPSGLADIGATSAPTFGNLNGGIPDVLAGNGAGDYNFFSNNVLPVELTAFRALVQGTEAVLRWETASETNNAGFEVQRLGSGDVNPAVEHLGFVTGHATTTEAHHYSFRVARLEAGLNRFRLRQVDFDGTAHFSPTIEVQVSPTGAYTFSSVAPSPTFGPARFSLAVAASQRVEIAVFDALGRLVTTLYTGTLGAGEARTFALDGTRWSSGTYVVVATGETFRAQRTLTLAH